MSEMIDVNSGINVGDLRVGTTGELAGTMLEAARVAGDAVAFVQDGMSVAGQIVQNPTGWLTSVGLDFLLSVVSPLDDAVQLVSGDGAALRQAAADFGGVGGDLQAMTNHLVSSADQALIEWRGDAALAAKRLLAVVADDLAAASSKSGALAQVMELSAMVMEVIEDVVRSLLSRFVDWLVMTWLPALASAAATFGGSTAAAGAATAIKAVTTSAETTLQINKLRALLNSIDDLLPKLGYALSDGVLAQVRPAVAKVSDAERNLRLPQIRKDYQVAPDPRGMVLYPRNESAFPTFPGTDLLWPFTYGLRAQFGKEMTATEADMIDSRGGPIFAAMFKADVYDKAIAVANERRPSHGNGNDDHNDAFRHAYWNALMVREYGAEWAEKFATAHEAVPGNPPEREAMDLYNNEVGRKIAIAHPTATPEELADLVDNAVARGDTVVIGRNGQLAFSDQVKPDETGGSQSPARNRQYHLGDELNRRAEGHCE